jgi:AraC-like DNA-binding protein
VTRTWVVTGCWCGGYEIGNGQAAITRRLADEGDLEFPRNLRRPFGTPVFPAGVLLLRTAHNGRCLRYRATREPSHATYVFLRRVETLLQRTQHATRSEIPQPTRAAVRVLQLPGPRHRVTSVLRCELGTPIEDEANNAGLFAAAQMLIRRHLTSHHLNPELIARQLNCSRAHLYRVFAARGESVARYLRELRLQRAHELLAGDNIPKQQIGDIAYGCGFEDPVHFARMFRQRFGLTPSELRSSRSLPEC